MKKQFEQNAVKPTKLICMIASVALAALGIQYGLIVLTYGAMFTSFVLADVMLFGTYAQLCQNKRETVMYGALAVVFAYTGNALLFEGEQQTFVTCFLAMTYFTCSYFCAMLFGNGLADWTKQGQLI